MPEKFIDIFPKLLKDYRKIKTESIIEDLEQLSQEKNLLYYDLNNTLLEYKIPKPLVIAYQRNNLSKTDDGKYYDIGSNDKRSYPTPRDTEQILNLGGTNQNALDIKKLFYNTKHKQSKLADYDFGKADYNRVSKAEALRKLGIKVYRKPTPKAKENTWVDELTVNEILDDYLPSANMIGVKDDQDLCKQNISKFRFLHQYGQNYSLSEFTYTSDGRYLPIIRQSIPVQNFRKYKVNLDEFYQTEPRADCAPGHSDKKTPKSIVYIIKLADLIYETNEYDIQFNIANTKESPEYKLNYEKIINIRSGLIDLARIETFKIYLAEFLRNNKSCITNLDDVKDKYPEWFESTNIDILKNIVSLYKEMSLEKFTRLRDLADKIENMNSYSYYRIFTFTDDGYSKFKNAVIDKTNSEMSKFINVLDTQEFYKTIQLELLDNISDSRAKELLKRKINSVDINITQMRSDDYENQRNQNRTNPATALSAASTLNINYDDKDTGKHQKNPSALIQGWYSGIKSTGSDSILSIIKLYDDLFKKKKELKQEYIKAQRAYVAIKKNSHYYDSEEEYLSELETRKNYLLQAKAKYEGGNDPINDTQCQGILNELKDFTNRFFKILDRETIVKEKQFMRLVYYVEYLNKKVQNLSEILGSIELLTKDEIINYYGTDVKESLNALKQKLVELNNELDDVRELKQKKLREKEELLRRLAELEDEIVKVDVRENEVIQSISEVDKQISSFNDEIEVAVENCYKHQADIVNLIDEVGNIITTEIQNADGKTRPQKQIKIDKRLENIISFKDDLEELQDELPEVVQDELEDVLSDPDESE